MICTALGLPTQAADEVLVSAASSLTDVLTGLGRDYERAAGVKVTLNVGGSNALARQIVDGAPVDLFVSADAAQMDLVERAGLVEPGSRRDLVSNQLVVIVPKGRRAIHGPDDLRGAGIRRVALADPAAVPAGVYAKQYLEARGIWRDLAARVVAVATVRAALAAVEGGDVDAGIVFATDARVGTRVEVAFAVPLDRGPRIVYPMALIRRRGASPAARAFHAYLASPAAQAAFARAGFIPLVRP